LTSTYTADVLDGDPDGKVVIGGPWTPKVVPAAENEVTVVIVVVVVVAVAVVAVAVVVVVAVVVAAVVVVSVDVAFVLVVGHGL